jgi:hypothetical protein
MKIFQEKALNRKNILMLLFLLSTPNVFSEMQSLRGQQMIGIPDFLVSAVSGFAWAAPVLDAAGEIAAAVFRFPNDATVRRVGIRTANITTGATIDMRLESIDPDTGNPSGNLYCTNSSGTLTIASTNDSVWVMSQAFVADCNVVRGTLGAVVILHRGVFNGQIATTLNEDLQNFPFTVSSNSASGYVRLERSPTFALEYSDFSYEPIAGIAPISAFSNTNFNHTDATNTRGLRFRLPFNARIVGAWLFTLGAAEQNIKLFDSDGASVIASVKLSTASMFNDASTRLVFATFTSSATLLADQWYRLVQSPTGPSDVAAWTISVTSPTNMATLPFGDNFHLTTAANPTQESSWTNTTTVQRPLIGPIIDGIDTSGGSNIFYDSTLYDAVIQ